MRAVSVRIDGLLVAEDEHTARVRIAEVPTGARDITVVAAARERTEPVDRSETVNVAAGQETAILIATPPRSLGSWITSAALVLAYGAVIIAGDIFDR
jgi:hypothetical protein